MHAATHNIVKLEPSWRARLMPVFAEPYMASLRAFLKQEIAQKHRIYPASSNWFAAFSHTPFDQVKVVILGQDPYHGAGQAHGLCFSVPHGVAVPPSLINIYKELKADVQVTPPSHGSLTGWAKQGVLLLNSVLTVREGAAASHQGRGWEAFTDEVIALLNKEHRHLVFILWGAYAQKKGQKIDRQKHLVIESVHPSPLSASRGFFGSRPFSRCNAYLVAHGKEAINWQL